MDSSTMLHCKDLLKEQLLKAKESLKGVDSNLKKFVSRPPLENPTRSFNKNGPQVNDKWRNKEESNSNKNFRRRPANVLGDDIENIPVKRRLGPKILHSSLSGPPRKIDDYEDEVPMKKPSVSSCVIPKAHVLPPRKEAVAVKTYTETRARDRRMFGALMGTLQKFRQEETQLKDKEDKRAQVEKKLEDAARREKEKHRQERQKLMDFRKQKESYIRAVENNMKLVKEQEQWEVLHQPLFNYIQTETKPLIYYLPKVHTVKTAELLELNKEELKKMIEDKRANVQREVEALIAQYDDVNVEELLGPEPGLESVRRSRREESLIHDGDDRDPNVSDDDTRSISKTIISNGSISKNSTFRSLEPEEQSDLEVKGHQNRRKGGIPIKEEKFDHDAFDYDDDMPVKQEETLHHSDDEEYRDEDDIDRSQVTSKYDKEMKNEYESPRNVVDNDLLD